MTTDDHSDVTVDDVSVRSDESDEYELVALATARIDGPDGATSVRRRYEALPRHNDIVDRSAIDVNDRLVDRPDAVHVHTKWYECEPQGDSRGDGAGAGDATGADGGTDGDDEAGEHGDYVRDAHETWLPDDPAVLADREGFHTAAHEHLLATVGDAYPGKRDDDEGPDA